MALKGLYPGNIFKYGGTTTAAILRSHRLCQRLKGSVVDS